MKRRAAMLALLSTVPNLTASTTPVVAFYRRRGGLAVQLVTTQPLIPVIPLGGPQGIVSLAIIYMDETGAQKTLTLSAKEVWEAIQPAK